MTEENCCFIGLGKTAHKIHKEYVANAVCFAHLDSSGRCNLGYQIASLGNGWRVTELMTKQNCCFIGLGCFAENSPQNSHAIRGLCYVLSTT